jgi:hypothetical protein
MDTHRGRQSIHSSRSVASAIAADSTMEKLKEGEL